MVQYIVEDDSTDVVEYESYLGKCRSAISSLIINAKEQAEQYLEYALQHIESEVVGERDVSMIMFSQALAIPATKDAALANAAQFVMLPLQDSTPRVVILGLFLLQTLSFRQGFTLDDSMVELVVQAICSDEESISLDAVQCLFSILMHGTSEMRIESASAIFEHIKEVEDDNTRSELLRHLTELCTKLTDDVALEILPHATELLQELYTASQESPLVSLSSGIGFVSAIFNKVGKRAPEFATEFLPLAIEFISNDMVADGVTILIPIVRNFGDSEGSVVQSSVEVITQYLPNAGSMDDLTSLIELCSATLPFVSDFEIISLIFSNCLEYGLSNESTPELKSEISPLLAAIFESTPELITSNLVRTFRVIFSTFSVIPHDKLLHMIAVCVPSFTPDEPIFQQALYTAVTTINMNASKARFNMSDFLLIVQAVSSFLPEESLVSIAYIYRTYVQAYTDQETNSQILEILPEIQIQQQ